MGRTPDRFPGRREDEGLLLTPGSVSPAENGEVRYVTGEGFRFFDETVEKALVWPFGTQYDSARSDSLSGTTSTSFQQKLRFAPTSLPSGTYILLWYVEILADAADKNVEFRVQQDDTTDLLLTQLRLPIANQGWPAMGVEELSLSGSPTFDLDFRRVSGGPVFTAQVRQARFVSWRVS